MIVVTVIILAMSTLLMLVALFGVPFSAKLEETDGVITGPCIWAADLTGAGAATSGAEVSVAESMGVATLSTIWTGKFVAPTLKTGAFRMTLSSVLISCFTELETL